jgi:hypothetical protein
MAMTLSEDDRNNITMLTANKERTQKSQDTHLVVTK